MRRKYRDELSELAATWSAATTADPCPHIAEVRGRLLGGPAVFVGSGGALAVARLAADDHTVRSGHVGVATTPFGLVGGLARTGSPVVLVSARARHPDVLAAARAAAAGNSPLVALLTAAAPDELDPKLASAVDIVISFPCPVRDGFLATNTVLAAGVAWLRDEINFSGVLPGLTSKITLPANLGDIRRIVAVHGARSASAVTDFEARCNEVGLFDVQVTDFRNLAHGRHVGLATRADASLVVTFSDSVDTYVANATRAILADVCPRLDLSTDLDFPMSALDLTVLSMRVFGELAAGSTIDPGRPGVPAFGRRLYHLPWARHVGRVRDDAAVQRKVSAAGASRDDPSLTSFYADALVSWRRSLSATRFSGVVLDYDGTCCTTEGRFGLPPESVRTELLRFIEEGGTLGFASGRGRSLHKDLRAWLPERHWASILLGLYNGALHVSLADEVPTSDETEADLAEAASRILSYADPLGLSVDVRPWQVTVSWAEPRTRQTGRLVDVVRSVAGRGDLRVKVSASAHSVDVIADTAGKPSVLAAMGTLLSGAVLAIGDQGQVGGNDFELLAAARHTLSVDSCSPDPTRCWNLGSASERGPDLLLRYLQGMRRVKNGSTFQWRLP